ncbi:AraC family transcriptional regulator [Pseudoflavitalea sp. G-6-1-2]|uniref:AraC family transcriptional regulator n=1 Tax=Pseudoflavitalea sp. G-6-1-2 TaxID=2728841 RepID=UPI00146A3A04|nr:AraC family transcriptional regulator [Pseudoflavitalea sp. G-6-1-2]NML19254.1 AraC family transcriptional regulator [Pseudoflavitalea sp. G-6-1-2]
MKILQFTIPVPINQTIIVQKDLLPYFYPHLHRHHEIQLTWVRKGEGTLVADNNMHSFTSNEIFWLGANQPHLFKSDPSYFAPKSKKTISALTIFFNPNGQLASFFDLPETRNIKKFIQQHSSGFKVPQQHVAEISNLILQLKDGSGVEQMISFLDIFKKLLSYKKLSPLSTLSQPQDYSENEGIRIATIYNYIMQHYDKPITLEDIAKQAHMTPQAFCRYFKKHTRLTFVNFLNEVRINEACKKLTEGSYDSITTVAYNCGFNSITNFNRVFKRVTSQSPSEYVDSFFQNVES